MAFSTSCPLVERRTAKSTEAGGWSASAAATRVGRRNCGRPVRTLAQGVGCRFQPVPFDEEVRRQNNEIPPSKRAVVGGSGVAGGPGPGYCGRACRGGRRRA